MSLQLKSIISSWTLKTYFSFDIIFFVQGNKISNGINVFPIHILFSLVLFHTENKYIYIYIYIYIYRYIWVPQADDPYFSNTLFNYVL